MTKSKNNPLKEKWETAIDSGRQKDWYNFYVAVWDGLWEVLYPGGTQA